MVLRKVQLKFGNRVYHLTGSTGGTPFKDNLSKKYAMAEAKRFRANNYPARVVKRNFGYLTYSSYIPYINTRIMPTTKKRRRK